MAKQQGQGSDASTASSRNALSQFRTFETGRVKASPELQQFATGQANARPRTGSTSQQPQTGAAESAVRVERIDTWESERQPNTFLLRLGDRAQRKQQRGFRKWQRRK